MRYKKKFVFIGGFIPGPNNLEEYRLVSAPGAATPGLSAEGGPANLGRRASARTET